MFAYGFLQRGRAGAGIYHVVEIGRCESLTTMDVSIIAIWKAMGAYHKGMDSARTNIEEQLAT
jgi:hypothetical protein